jgi:hypothetical protein
MTIKDILQAINNAANFRMTYRMKWLWMLPLPVFRKEQQALKVM